MNPHGQRAHALLSASGADRWMHCPPSARLEDESGAEEGKNIYAEEGTAAHELGEYRLKEALGLPTGETEAELMVRLDEYYNDDMEEYVQEYVDMVLEKYHAALAKDPTAKILLEQRLSFARWIPESFGTGDAVVISEDKVTVIDLKYGKGKPVSADNNPQLKLYALGAVGAYGPVYDFEEVEVMIVQPRLRSFTDWSTDVDSLLTWAEEVVRPAAVEAFAGAGEFAAGDWCQWCRVKANCDTLATKSLEVTRYEFRQANLLSLDEISDILGKVDGIISWAEAVKKFAQVQAEQGAHIPGYKLVEGRSNRCYIDEEFVMDKLVEEAYELDKIAPRKLLGITAMEKLLSPKVFKALLNPLVARPPGKPTLVPATDKRAEFNSAARDFEAIE